MTRESENLRPPRATRMPLDPRTGALGSVENALEVLLLLRERASVRPSQISAHLGVSRSTTHRLLRTLSSYGMIEQGEHSSGYHAGPALAELGLSAAHQTNLVRTLHPFLQELSHEVGETAHAIVLEGASCTFVDSVESTHALRTTSRVGTRYPAYVVSGGKLLLAQLDPAALLELFPHPQLPAFNQRSLTSREDLFKQLDEIKNLGYATNFGESELGIAAVAVAQQTISGVTAAAVAISAPESRMPKQRIAPLVDRLRATAGRARMRLP